MYKAPSSGLGPRATTLLRPLPPRPWVPGIWSAKQFSTGINKPPAPSIWSRGGCHPRPGALTSPHHDCSPADEAPDHWDTRADKPTQKAPSALSCMPAHLPPLNPQAMPGGREESRSSIWEGGGVAISKYLPVCSSHSQASWEEEGEER